MNYWEECVSEALDEVNIAATKEQIEVVASWVEGAHENYGLATSLEVTEGNHRSAAEIELQELKDNIEKKTMWELTTSPCVACNTTGTVKDGWGRDVRCDTCKGKGRVHQC